MHRWFTIFSLAVSLVMMDLSRKTAEMDRRVFCDFHVNYYAHAMYDHIISSYLSGCEASWACVHNSRMNADERGYIHGGK